ncbi:MAG: hypothetical protein AB9866_08285 [Syntrophobacteraceae bacterium]
MNRSATTIVIAAIIMGLIWLTPVFAQRKGPPPDFAINAYKTLLSEVDKNGDGKISMEECYSMWKDKGMAEKNCKYWDANGDGVITEEEYVSKAMKKAP